MLSTVLLATDDSSTMTEDHQFQRESRRQTKVDSLDTDEELCQLSALIELSVTTTLNIHKV